SLNPIRQEDALSILGFEKPFNEIHFGPFTGNATLMRWFRKLCIFFGVKGRCSYFYKPHGAGKTSGVTADCALELLQTGLRSSNCAFIYHCNNHYMCPIGYEVVPQSAEHAYSDVTSGVYNEDERKSWILVGDTSKKQPGIHCIPWEEIVKDLNTQMPYLYDVRRRYKGIKKLNTSKEGGNIHCLMIFRKCSTRCSDVAKQVLQPIQDSGSNIDDNILKVNFNSVQEDTTTELIDLDI
ncbi:uncharacterized protein TRIADDRAFT_31068, partial [Trichoplax adhaerens]